MIEKLPLDVFSEDREPPADSAAPASSSGAADANDGPAHERQRCQMCGAEADPDADVCPRCGDRLRPLGAPAGELPAAGPLECQWCDAPLPDGATICPRCGSPAPDPTERVPGLTELRPSDEIHFDDPDTPARASLTGSPAVDIGFHVLRRIIRRLGE